MSLQSYLFFGSANQLHQHIKELLLARPDCRHLLFDFRLVTGIDSSATHSFEQIKQAVDKSGARLVLVNLSAGDDQRLSRHRISHQGHRHRIRSRPCAGILRGRIIAAHRTT